jgi:hypothetical protein
MPRSNDKMLAPYIRRPALQVRERGAAAPFDQHLLRFSVIPHVEVRVTEAGVNQRGETIWQSREIMTDQRPYTTTGLARTLGTRCQTLRECDVASYYPSDMSEAERQEMVDAIGEGKMRVQYAEGGLFSAYATTIVVTDWVPEE